MTEFDDLLKRLRKCTLSEKNEVFKAIRDDINIHPLEKEFNVRAEVILEAIRRSSDLTKRGIRGVIAEATFIIEVVTSLDGWKDETQEGEFPFDALISRDGRKIRIQVKMQRKKAGRPMKANEGYRDLPSDQFVVEVQRTRGGKDAQGNETRPYRFDEFDVLAVCMEPSTRDWTHFMYCATKNLKPEPGRSGQIRKFQAVPIKPKDAWTNDLNALLENYYYEA